MLKVSDRTVGIGKGGLEMSEDLGCCGSARWVGRQLGRRTHDQQRRADLALAEVKPFPKALPGPLASSAVGDGTARRGDAAGNGALQESPHRMGGHAEPSDFVGEPNAEGTATTGTSIPVAAKHPPGADGLAPRISFVVATQKAMPNQRADDLAMRTRHLLETFANRVPFLLAPAKPALLAHVYRMPRENRYSYERGKVRGSRGVRFAHHEARCGVAAVAKFPVQ
jgi:hypothetical protein